MTSHAQHGRSGNLVGGTDMDEEWMSRALRAVLEYYDLPVPAGSGERPMRCPAHDDAHASASANMSKGLWHCHACGAGGSAVQIVMAKEKCDYADGLGVAKEITGSEPVNLVRKTVRRSGSKRWTPPRLRGNK